jgi:exonuclease VII small subunit
MNPEGTAPRYPAWPLRAVAVAVVVLALPLLAACQSATRPAGLPEYSEARVPDDMFPQGVNRQNHAIATVTYAFKGRLQEMSSDPVETYRIMAFFEYLANEAVSHSLVNTIPRHAIRKLIEARSDLRDALHISADASTEEAIRQSWAMHRFLKLASVYRQTRLPPVETRLEALAAAKSRFAEILGDTEPVPSDQISSLVERLSRAQALDGKHLPEVRRADPVINEAQEPLAFAADAFSEDRGDAGRQAIRLAYLLFERAERILRRQPPAPKRSDAGTRLATLFPYSHETLAGYVDLSATSAVLSNMNRKLADRLGNGEEMVAALRTAGYPLDRHTASFSGMDTSLEHAALATGTIADTIAQDIDAARDIANAFDQNIAALQSIAADLSAAGLDLDAVARSLADAVANGIQVNLEAASRELGFDSFADAVAAYNAAYGTNFTVDQARQALQR